MEPGVCMFSITLTSKAANKKNGKQPSLTAEDFMNLN
jgi:hypothetical protein